MGTRLYAYLFKDQMVEKEFGVFFADTRGRKSGSTIEPHGFGPHTKPTHACSRLGIYMGKVLHVNPKGPKPFSLSSSVILNPKS